MVVPPAYIKFVDQLRSKFKVTEEKCFFLGRKCHDETGKTRVRCDRFVTYLQCPVQVSFYPQSVYTMSDFTVFTFTFQFQSEMHIFLMRL